MKPRTDTNLSWLELLIKMNNPAARCLVSQPLQSVSNVIARGSLR